ncbi:MAG: RnfABCDGE type electron transport complex subunit A [Dethiobacteria bacterium]
MDIGRIMAIIFIYIFVENFVFNKFLGTCPFLGVSKKMETAVGMSMAVIFVMIIATLFTWLVYYYVLLPFNLLYMQIVTFILIIASLVQLVETMMKKVSPVLYQGLGIFLPLITTNCAVLGAAIMAINQEFSFVESLFFALAASVGFGLALIIMAGIRERMELVELPKAFSGTVVTLITAGILSLAFMGFQGMLKL